MILQNLLRYVPAICAIYIFLRAVWYLYLHPLRHIPGPVSWIIFPILRHISALRGRLALDLNRFHGKHGEAVRTGPSEVSFIAPEAWTTIYGHPQLPRAVSSGSSRFDIIGANDANHSKYRKALSPAFSARALQMQESLLKGYVDKLIDRLNGLAESQLPVDMVKWYNLIAFDVIGDLALGTSFGGLDNSQYHYWLSTIFDLVKMIPLVDLKDAYPIIIPLLAALLPWRLLKARQAQVDYTKETVRKRLENESAHGRGDFMDSMLRHRGEKHGLTDAELEANSSVLIMAGSETTSTLLSGVTYWLLKSPNALAKVADEVRSTMQSEADINLHNATTRLPYMLACLDEALRLYPPGVTGLGRRTVTSLVISGYHIPPGTIVSVNQLAAYWSSTNFHNPQEFIPERWLPEAKSDPASPFFSDKRDVFQPFSMGPRNCIGRNLAYAEMRLVLARVLWNFDLELCEESSEWKDQKTYGLWDKPPLMCKIKVRD